MSPVGDFSEEEKKWRNEIRDLYNSGKSVLSVRKAVEFLEACPNSYLAKYTYAVQHGDWSYSCVHSQRRKDELLAVARAGIKELYEDSNLTNLPVWFQESVRNEFFWFFEMHREQYEFGIQRLEDNPQGGHYSACVGASMLALKSLRSRRLSDCEHWAEESLKHFRKFEALCPDWYNINLFSARATACLGRYNEAVVLFEDMFRKQGQPVNDDELREFNGTVAEIKRLRTS